MSLLSALHALGALCIFHLGSSAHAVKRDAESEHNVWILIKVWKRKEGYIC